MRPPLGREHRTGLPDLISAPQPCDQKGKNDGAGDQAASIKFSFRLVGNKPVLALRQPHEEKGRYNYGVKPVHSETRQGDVDPMRERHSKHERREQQRKSHALAFESAPEPREGKGIHHAAIQTPSARLASRSLVPRLGHVTLAEKQQQLIDDYLIIDDAQERLAAIVERARRVPSLPDAERTEPNRVRGCMSQAWITTAVADGICQFRSDADSPLVRGLLKLLCDLYSGASPAEVAGTEPVLLEKLGLTRNLSPTRLNGLSSVRAKIRDFAAAQAKSGAK